MSQKEILDALGTACSAVHDFEWLGVNYKIRTITPMDEVFVYERAVAEAKSQLARLILIRVYIVALMIVEVEGTNLWEAIFGYERPAVPTDKDRSVVCDAIVQALNQWDRRTFRLFFKYCWAWNESQAAVLIKEKGIESFMTPDEKVAYQEYQKLEQIEAVQAGMEEDQITDSTLDMDRPPLDEELEDQD